MKLDINVTYRFGHNSGICLPFFFKVSSKCPYLKGVSHRQPVWTKPVQIGSVQIGFTILKAHNRNRRSGPNRSGPVQFSVFLRLRGPDLRTLVMDSYSVKLIISILYV